MSESNYDNVEDMNNVLHYLEIIENQVKSLIKLN